MKNRSPHDFGYVKRPKPPSQSPNNQTTVERPVEKPQQRPDAPTTDQAQQANVHD